MEQARLVVEPMLGHHPVGCTGIDLLDSSRSCALPPLTIVLRRNLIETTVAQVFGVHARELQGLSRGRAPVAQARQVAMYLAHVLFGLSLSDTGRLFDRDRTTVAHACTVVEDLRDGVVFDRILELLEGVVLALLIPRETTAQLSN